MKITAASRRNNREIECQMDTKETCESFDAVKQSGLCILARSNSIVSADGSAVCNFKLNSMQTIVQVQGLIQIKNDQLALVKCEHF